MTYNRRIDVVGKGAKGMRLEQNHLTLVKKRDRGYICQYTTMTDIGR